MTMTKGTRQTGQKAATAAGKSLGSARTTGKQKTAAASAVSQAPDSTGRTGKKAASAAAATLADKKATKAEKSAAASALSQARSTGRKK
ncbi:hypothetical protein [Streptacidiphilus sp. ASG 303]|uniref:hypothetical protein n=1 Tax=Streptacidiphilus sp. ASG 303 TaxID=2896847 RepID=UPI001E3DD7AC|nr:hypothetical protein [Streptacidiphilus sp. ASG 303]